MVNKVNRNVEFLTSEDGTLYGYQRRPGDDVALVSASTNSVTGGSRLSAGGADVIGRMGVVANSLTVMGDSIHAYGFATSGGGTTSQSIVEWANDQLRLNGVGFDIVNYLAVNGVTVDIALSTQLPVALTDGSAIAWVHVGANNLSSSIQNDTIASLLPKFTSLISQLAAVKSLVIIDSINPVSQAGATGAKGRAYTFQSVNAAIAQICSQYSNVMFNDTYSAMVDAASSTLNPLSNYVSSVDGIHQNSIGAQAAGYATVKNLYAKRAQLVKYKTAGANLLPTFSGTGGTATPASGTISGMPPANWNVQHVNGSNAVTIGTTPPDAIKFTFTNGGVQSVTYIQALNNAALVAALAAGGLIQGGFQFQAYGNSGILRLGAAIRVTGGTVRSPGDANTTTLWNAHGKSANEPAIIYPTNAFGGMRVTPPCVISPSCTNIEFIIQIELAATTGACTLEISNPFLNLLT